MHRAASIAQHLQESIIIIAIFANIIESLSEADLTLTLDDPLIGCQLAQRHRAAHMQFLGADRNFGTQSELRAVVKACRGIDKHSSRVDGGHKGISRSPILSNDCIGVIAMLCNMVKR